VKLFFTIFRLKRFKLYGLLLFCFLLAGIYSSLVHEKRAELFTSNEFIIGYFGTLLGLTITIVSLLAPVFERIAIKAAKMSDKDSLYKRVLPPHRVINLLKELKHDTLLIFLCFIANIAVIFLRSMDIGKAILIGNYCIKIYSLSTFLQFSTMFLSLTAIYDIMTGLFTLLEIYISVLGIMDQTQSNNQDH